MEVMRLLKYLFVPWIAVAVYSFVSVYHGTTGIAAYRALLREREKIRENIEDLRVVNKELEGTMDALLYDSETIRVKARELGYGEEGERFARIAGVPGVRREELNPGTVRTAARPLEGSGVTPKLASWCAALALFAVFLAWDVLHRRDPGGPFNRAARYSRDGAGFSG
ncbi:MAG: septum formation initiator family protein [Treponema sp.]|jgi:cell division protein FtsB|nr:septum formation initiator family protein [Treponema sp.]